MKTYLLIPLEEAEICRQYEHGNFIINEIERHSQIILDEPINEIVLKNNNKELAKFLIDYEFKRHIGTELFYCPKEGKNYTIDQILDIYKNK